MPIDAIAILVTSHTGHLRFLRASLNSVRGTTSFLVCGYDNHGRLPPSDLVSICDVFFTGGKRKGLSRGEVFSLTHGLALCLGQANHVLKICGDSVVEKPDGVAELPKHLDGADVISPQWTPRIPAVGLFFGKTLPLLESFRDLGSERGDCIEGRHQNRMRRLEMKAKIIRAKSSHLHGGAGGLWWDLLGYRHLHSEEKQNIRVPPEYYEPGPFRDGRRIK